MRVDIEIKIIGFWQGDEWAPENLGFILDAAEQAASLSGMTVSESEVNLPEEAKRDGAWEITVYPSDMWADVRRSWWRPKQTEKVEGFTWWAKREPAGGILSGGYSHLFDTADAAQAAAVAAVEQENERLKFRAEHTTKIYVEAPLAADDRDDRI
jgi:hypothetical protein